MTSVRPCSSSMPFELTAVMASYCHNPIEVITPLNETLAVLTPETAERIKEHDRQFQAAAKIAGHRVYRYAKAILSGAIVPDRESAEGRDHAAYLANATHLPELLPNPTLLAAATAPPPPVANPQDPIAYMDDMLAFFNHRTSFPKRQIGVLNRFVSAFCPRLQAWGYSDNSGSFTYSEFTSEAGPAITKAKLRCNAQTKLPLSEYRRVHSLHLSGKWEHLTGALTTLPAASHVTFVGSTISRIAFDHLPPNLTSLELLECTDISKDGFLSLEHRPLQKLRIPLPHNDLDYDHLPTTLRIFQCSNITNSLLKTLPPTKHLQWTSRLQQLEELSYPLAGLDVASAALLPTSLKKLNLIGKTVVTKATFERFSQAIARLTQLQELTLPANLVCMDDMVIQFPASLTKVRITVWNGNIRSIVLRPHHKVAADRSCYSIAMRVALKIKDFFISPPLPRALLAAGTIEEASVWNAEPLAWLPDNLTKLDINNEYYLKNALGQLRRFKNLHTFAFTGFSGHQETVRHLPSGVQCLSLGYDSTDKNSSLAPLRKFTKLTVLRLHGCNSIDGETLSQLPVSVTEVQVSSCKKVSQKHIKAFLDSRRDAFVSTESAGTFATGKSFLSDTFAIAEA